MNKKKKTFITLTALLSMMGISCLAMAGDLEPSAAPGSTMHTLEDIYNVVTAGCPDCGCPNCDGAPVAKTGQTTSYATGDDGDHEAGVGVTWPSPRFTDNGNGTVTDNLTGLIWLKNANPCGTKAWADAIAYCNSLASGTAGLTDGSAAGDWRLPNVKELQSLINYGYDSPALPTIHPFTGVQYSYWSGTSYYSNVSYAWRVTMYDGSSGGYHKANLNYVWPVRSDN